jgi:Flp pilus assembly protein TadB
VVVLGVGSEGGAVNPLALLSGLMVFGGLMVAVPALRPTAVRRPSAEEAETGRRPRRRWRDAIPVERVGLSVAVALAVAVLTRWPVAALASAGAAAFATSPTLRRGIPDAEKAEALTIWAEMLRDATGTPRGIEGVLVATADGAPPLIRPHTRKLAQRLPYEPLEVALDDLADDLDHPIGDLVVFALRLAAQSGGRQIRAVLDDLATVAREEARMHRRIDVARARPRADMRAVLMIMGFFVLLFVASARTYLEPYGTALGQLVLLAVASIWAMGIWLMARMGQRGQVARFLSGSADARADGGDGPGRAGDEDREVRDR